MTTTEGQMLPLDLKTYLEDHNFSVEVVPRRAVTSDWVEYIVRYDGHEVIRYSSSWLQVNGRPAYPTLSDTDAEQFRRLLCAWVPTTATSLTRIADLVRQHFEAKP